LQRKRLPGLIETARLESSDPVVGEMDDFQKQCAGGERSGRDCVHGEIFAQFADPSFDRRAPIMKISDSDRSQRQVSDPGRIDVMPPRKHDVSASSSSMNRRATT